MCSIYHESMCDEPFQGLMMEKGEMTQRQKMIQLKLFILLQCSFKDTELIFIFLKMVLASLVGEHLCL